MDDKFGMQKSRSLKLQKHIAWKSVVLLEFAIIYDASAIQL